MIGLAGSWSVKWTQATRRNAHAVSHGALPLASGNIRVVKAYQYITMDTYLTGYLTDVSEIVFDDGYRAKWTAQATCILVDDAMHVSFNAGRLMSVDGTPSPGVAGYTDKGVAIRTKVQWRVVGVTRQYRVDRDTLHCLTMYHRM